MRVSGEQIIWSDQGQNRVQDSRNLRHVFMSSLFDSQRYTLLWLFKGRWLALVQPWPGTIWAWPGHPATQTATRPSGHGHGHPASRPPDQHANSHRPSGHMPAVRPRPRPSGQPATPSTCKLPGHRPRPRPGHGHTRKKSILLKTGRVMIFCLK